ncbi:MAG TPA: hypothetical protein VHX60_08815 [Acidobacteriaceae bacterium]|nr:hypothetical protein [Acidobacteriaceae bacterium]
MNTKCLSVKRRGRTAAGIARLAELPIHGDGQGAVLGWSGEREP